VINNLFHQKDAYYLVAWAKSAPAGILLMLIFMGFRCLSFMPSFFKETGWFIGFFEGFFVLAYSNIFLTMNLAIKFLKSFSLTEVAVFVVGVFLLLAVCGSVCKLLRNKFLPE